MGKKDNEEETTDPCPPEPAGCGGKGYTVFISGKNKLKEDCFTCGGSGRIPKNKF